MINELPPTTKSYLASVVDLDQAALLNVIRDTILNSSVTTLKEGSKFSLITFSSGPSPVIGFGIIEGKVVLTPFSIVTLNKTKKTFKVLEIVNNSLVIENIELTSLKEIIMFVINSHPSQAKPSTGNIGLSTGIKKGSTGKGGRQIKLPRKSSSGD